MTIEMMSQKQCRFLRMTGQLFDFLHSQGYQAKYGEAKRSDEQAEINAIGEAGRLQLAALIELDFPELASKILNNGKNNGIRNSTHGLQLAIDIDLFRNGRYLANTDDHLPLGLFWESIGGTWGGRFGDGNHYSLEHGGVR